MLGSLLLKPVPSGAVDMGPYEYAVFKSPLDDSDGQPRMSITVLEMGVCEGLEHGMAWLEQQV